MGKLFLLCCPIFLILIGFLDHNNYELQVHAHGENTVSPDQKLNSQIDENQGLQCISNWMTNERFNVSDLNQILVKGQSNCQNTFPNKDSKDLTLENMVKNYENSGEKNILKRSLDKKPPNKTARKNTDLKKHKEKHNSIQKKGNRFKNSKEYSCSGISRKTKRTGETINKKDEEGTPEAVLNDKKYIVQQKKSTEEGYIYDENDDSLQDDFYDMNTDSVSNYEYDDNNYITKSNKNTGEKENIKQKSSKLYTKSMKDKSKGATRKNTKDLATQRSNMTHAVKVQHERNIKTPRKKQKEESNLLLDETDYIEPDAQTFNDVDINKEKKVEKAYSKHQEYKNKRRSYDKANKKEDSLNKKEKELKLLSNWEKNSGTDFDDSLQVEEAKDINPEPNSKSIELKNQDEISEEDQFDPDFYEDEKTAPKDNENPSKTDEDLKSKKTGHFLAEVSKFPVCHNQANNYGNSYDDENSLQNDHERSSQMDEHSKNNDTKLFQSKLNNGKTHFGQHLDKPNDQNVNNKKSYKNKLKSKQMPNRFQKDKSHSAPLFDNIKKVYKLDPLNGDIELQNISNILKKRSQRSNTYREEKIFAGNQKSNFVHSEVLPGYDVCEVNVKDEFKNKINDQDSHPLIREQRRLGDFKNVHAKNEKPSFSNKVKQGWTHLKSRVLKGNKNTSNSFRNSDGFLANSTDSYNFTTPLLFNKAPKNSCKINDQEPNRNSDSNKNTEDEVSDMNDFLTGKLSERIVDEIFVRLQKSNKIAKGLGVGRNLQNVSLEKCIVNDEADELISLDAMNKSMHNFVSSIAEHNDQKCFEVPTEMKSFLIYLFSVEYKNPPQHYSELSKSDGSFIFSTNFVKDMCPGECVGDGNVKNEDNYDNLNVFKENKIPEQLNENVNSSIDKIVLQSENTDLKSGINHVDIINSKGEHDFPLKNIDFEVQKTVEMTLPGNRKSLDETKTASTTLIEEQMHKLKENNTRNKKTLLTHYDENNLPVFYEKQRNPLSSKDTVMKQKIQLEDNENKQELEDKQPINYNKNFVTVVENSLPENSKQSLRKEINNNQDIPDGIDPDLFDIEKVKRIKEKYNNIYYPDTPHFESPLNTNSDMYESEGNNKAIVADESDKIDEDGFEFAHMEKAPMEYYDV